VYKKKFNVYSYLFKWPLTIFAKKYRIEKLDSTEKTLHKKSINGFKTIHFCYQKKTHYFSSQYPCTQTLGIAKTMITPKNIPTRRKTRGNRSLNKLRIIFGPCSSPPSSPPFSFRPPIFLADDLVVDYFILISSFE